MTTKPDFQQMPMEQLRAYVLAHRDDDEAFHAYIDRRRAASPHTVTMTVEEAEAFLQRRFGQQSQL